MQKDDRIRLRHMLDAGRKAVSFAVGRSRLDLDDDAMFTFALMKAIEIIGEAAAKISGSSKEQLREIPWPLIVGMRNRLIHAYDDINLDLLWQTVTRNLPPLIEVLEKIVERK